MPRRLTCGGLPAAQRDPSAGAQGALAKDTVPGRWRHAMGEFVEWEGCVGGGGGGVAAEAFDYGRWLYVKFPTSRLGFYLVGFLEWTMGVGSCGVNSCRGAGREVVGVSFEVFREHFRPSPPPSCFPLFCYGTDALGSE